LADDGGDEGGVGVAVEGHYGTITVSGVTLRYPPPVDEPKW
jgi:hypothetical protein